MTSRGQKDMTQSERPTAAFILSLLAGLFMLLGGATSSMMSSFGYGRFGGYGMMSGYGYGGMWMMGFGRNGLGFGMFGLLQILFGVIVIIGAVMLNSRPLEHTTWGTVIVVGAALSIFGGMMGGFGVGLVLGLIGGILAITWKPPQTASTT